MSVERRRGLNPKRSMEALAMIYVPRTGVWTTPGGRPVEFEYREGTNDWNTVNSCLGANDEYGLAGLDLGGWALDLGAYIGPVCVALAVDNPTIDVLAVEPVPDNARLVRVNAERNGVADRVHLFEGSIGPPGVTSSLIRYGYHGEPNLEHHAFVGNTSLAYEYGGDTPHTEDEVETLGIAALLDRYGITTAEFTKIDVEGAEFAFLDAPAADLSRLGLIVGEWHNVRGHTQADVVRLLGSTHEIAFSGPAAGPGGFRAALR